MKQLVLISTVLLATLAIGFSDETPVMAVSTDTTITNSTKQMVDFTSSRISPIFSIEHPSWIQKTGMGKGLFHDRQDLGFILTENEQLQIRLTSSNGETITARLLANDNKLEKDLTLTTNWATMSSTVPTVPFIDTPFGNKSIEIEYRVVSQRAQKKLPVYDTQQNQASFIAGWDTSAAEYALIKGQAFQLLVPAKDKNAVKELKEFGSIDKLIAYYDQDIFPFYNKLAGFDGSSGTNQNDVSRYFMKADKNGPGGAYYGKNWTANSYDTVDMWLKKHSWGSLHEIGHGYQTNWKNNGMYTGEVSNNIFAASFLYSYNPQFADSSSFLFTNNKTKAENEMYTTVMEKKATYESMDLREKLVVLMMLKQKAGDEAFIKLYQGTRDEVNNSSVDQAAYHQPDLLNRYYSEHSKLDFSPVLLRWGLTLTDNQGTQNRLNNYPAVSHLADVVPKAQLSQARALVDKQNAITSNFEIVTNQEISQLGLKGQVTLQLTNEDVAKLQGNQIQLKDGAKVIQEKTITGNDLTFTDVPNGTYTLGFSGKTIMNYGSDTPYVTVKEAKNTVKVNFNVESYSKTAFKEMISKVAITDKSVQVVFKDDRFKDNLQIHMLDEGKYISEITSGKAYYSSFDAANRTWSYNNKNNQTISLKLMDYQTKKVLATIDQEELLALVDPLITINHLYDNDRIASGTLKPDVSQETLDGIQTMITALISKDEKSQAQDLLDRAQTLYIKGFIDKTEVTANSVRITFKDDRFKSYYRILMNDNKQYISEIDTGKAYYSSINQQTRVWSYNKANTQNIELVFQDGKTRKTLTTLTKTDLLPPSKQGLTVEQNPVRIPVGHPSSKAQNWTPTADELKKWVKNVKINGISTDDYTVTFANLSSGTVPTDKPLTNYWTMKVTAKGLSQTLQVNYEVYEEATPKTLTVEQNPVRVPVGHPSTQAQHWTPTADELKKWVKNVKIDGISTDDYTVTFANLSPGTVPTNKPLTDYWTMKVTAKGLSQTLRVDYEVYEEATPKTLTVEQNPVRVPVGYPSTKDQNWTPTADELKKWVKNVKVDGISTDDYTVTFVTLSPGTVPTNEPLTDYWTMKVTAKGLSQTLRVDYEVYLENDPQVMFKDMISDVAISNNGIDITFKDDRYKNDYQIKLLQHNAYTAELTRGAPYYSSFNKESNLWHYKKIDGPNISLKLVDNASKKTLATLTQSELLAITQK